MTIPSFRHGIPVCIPFPTGRFPAEFGLGRGRPRFFVTIHDQIEPLLTALRSPSTAEAQDIIGPPFLFAPGLSLLTLFFGDSSSSPSSLPLYPSPPPISLLSYTAERDVRCLCAKPSLHPVKAPATSDITARPLGKTVSSGLRRWQVIACWQWRKCRVGSN